MDLGRALGSVNPTLESLRISLPYRAMQWSRGPRAFINPPVADHTPLRITGGIGDLIMALGVAEELNRIVGDVKVYSKWPDIGRFFSSLPQLNDKDLLVEGYDFIISLNCVAFFQFAKNFRGFQNKKLEQVLVQHIDFLTSDDEWEMFADHHPHFDGLLGDKCVKEKITREEIPYKYLGLNYPGPLKLKQRYMSPKGTKYITIHDGFDANNTEVKNRSMKTWDLQHWKDLIEIIRGTHPRYLTVQLGGPTSRRIKGVDQSYVGNLSFEESMKILSGSSLHIDGDSGLVHAARVFDVQSIVMFGPTNADFFGYKENINIKSKFCGNCWWLNPDWMARCQLDFEVPECMDSIEPGMVAKLVDNCLERA